MTLPMFISFTRVRIRFHRSLVIRDEEPDQFAVIVGCARRFPNLEFEALICIVHSRRMLVIDNQILISMACFIVLNDG